MTRIFIPSKNRPATICTHRYFKDFDYHVVLHSYEQALEYIREMPQTHIDPERILVSGVPADQFGLTRQREWVIHESGLCAQGDWIVFADDNIRDVQAVAEGYYRDPSLDVEGHPEYRSVFEAHCEPARFMNEIVPECINVAAGWDAHHVGFATTDNFFYRAKHWKKIGYIIGKLMVWHCHDQIFDHEITMEDFELTAQSVLRHGVAPVNNWVYPVAGHYEAGGMGTKKERLASRVQDVVLLLKKYPQFFTEKVRADGNPDLGLRLYQDKQIAQWRNYMRSIGR